MDGIDWVTIISYGTRIFDNIFYPLSGEDVDTTGPTFLGTTGPHVEGAACLSHEHRYRDDPKKALSAYFDREGIDPAPEFEFIDGAGFGKQHCRME